MLSGNCCEVLLVADKGYNSQVRLINAGRIISAVPGTRERERNRQYWSLTSAGKNMAAHD
ncbi:MAG: hypothetical protein DRR06_11160 [Gammaproteobacteria bacterium]|nr:MAG: hypothetical protein DRR42_23360 [Gammaproteobacteria bacterium]RLA43836.1 MAG: hypothetical protein DRR06_11160 [Gammaproteobacteria bacterium]